MKLVKPLAFSSLLLSSYAWAATHEFLLDNSTLGSTLTSGESVTAGGITMTITNIVTANGSSAGDVEGAGILFGKEATSPDVVSIDISFDSDVTLNSYSIGAREDIPAGAYWTLSGTGGSSGQNSIPELAGSSTQELELSFTPGSLTQLNAGETYILSHNLASLAGDALFNLEALYIGDQDAEVSNIGITKTRIYQATGNLSSTPSGNYEFKAFIEGSGLTQSFSVGNLDIPGSSNDPTFLFDDDSFEIESGNLSAAQLNSSYPYGSYGFALPNQSVTIDASGMNFPNAPAISSSRGTWKGNCLEITAEEAAIGFTLNSNVSTASGFTTLVLYSDESDTDIINLVNASGGAISGHINGGLLTEENYTIELEFDEVTFSNSFSDPIWAPSGANSFTINSARLIIPLKVRPALIESDVVYTAPKAATISLPTSTGYQYQFKRSTNLSSFTILETRNGSGNIEQFSYSGTDTQSFYWVDTIKAPPPISLAANQTLSLHTTESSSPPLELSTNASSLLTLSWGSTPLRTLNNVSYSYTNTSGNISFDVSYPESTLSSSIILAELNTENANPSSPLSIALSTIASLGETEPTEAQMEAVVDAAYNLSGNYVIDYDENNRFFITRNLTASLNPSCVGNLSVNGTGITLSEDGSTIQLSGDTPSYTDNVVGFFE